MAETTGELSTAYRNRQGEAMTFWEEPIPKYSAYLVLITIAVISALILYGMFLGIS